MAITKKDCLEFLRTHKVNGEKNERVFGLFVLVEKLGGVWPSYKDMFLDARYPEFAACATNKVLLSIDGYTQVNFDNMFYAKNEIKRRDNELKAQKEEHERLYGKMINCRCVITPVIEGAQPKLSGSHNIPPRPFLAEALKTQAQFQSKTIAEKMKGAIDPRLHDALFAGAATKVSTEYEDAIRKAIISPTWAEIDPKYRASRLKAEQEAKQMKMRDSNANMKEGDKAIVSNKQGFVMSYGAELIGHEVEIVKFFSHMDIDLAAVNFNGSVYCFRKSMLEPVKTERQKAIEFYMGTVSAAMNGSSKGQDWGQHTRTIESLIDSGYLNTKIPPVAR